jgi:ferredoxin-NADP reductase
MQVNSGPVTVVTEASPAAAKKPAYREVEADLEVRGYELVADGVVTLTLAHPDDTDLPEWSPGAHIDLVLTPSLVRQYSLCGSTSNRAEWRVGILLDPTSRGGSQFVHDEIRKGSTVRVRGPRNHFPLVSSPRYQFVAGGIGVTPILTMIEAAEARGAEWHLLYGGRERASMGFVDELDRYGDRVTVCPQDEKGMLDLDSLLSEARTDTLVYCCGPEGLLTAVEDACRPWPEGSLHIERFAAKPTSDEPSPDALDSFEVVCQRSGVTLTVPADKSIYEVVEEADIDVLGSCMDGVCGTCECDVIEGEPDHRDSVLSDAERASGKAIMICVSRSRSERLVLDL